MKLIKSNEHAFLSKTHTIDNKHYLICSAILYASIDEAKLLTQQQLWRETKPFLRKSQPLDEGYAKQNGEVVMYGHCFSKEAVQAKAVSFEVGSLKKELLVHGERFIDRTLTGFKITDPQPFTKMKVGYENSYGGKGFAKNPIGHGYIGKNTKAYPLRAHIIEDSEHFITGFESTQYTPQAFEPLSISWSERSSKWGTFDEKYLQERWPYYPHDLDPSIFNTAPKDQQIHGFFKGNEAVCISGMHLEHEVLKGVLPAKRIRMFATKFVKKKNDDKVYTEVFEEVENRIDTLIFFSDINRVAIVYRGSIEVQNERAKEVIRLLVATESMNEEKKSIEYYREEEQRSIFKAVDFELDMSDHKKAMQKVKDLPKQFDNELKKVKGDAPSLRQTPQKAIAKGMKNIDAMQQRFDKLAKNSKNPLLSEAFAAASAHVASKGGGSVFENMKGLPARVKAMGMKVLDESEKAAAKTREDLNALPPLAKSKLDPKIFEALESTAEKEALEKRFATDSEGNVVMAIQNWEEGASFFVADCAEALKLHPSKIAQVEACHLREMNMHISYLGYNPKEEIIPKWYWQQDEEIVIPQGFVLPFFEKNVLKKVIIRPHLVDEEKNILSAKDDSEVKGSNKCDMVLEGGCGDTLLLVNGFVEAWVLNQELYNVCSIGVFDTAEAFNKSAYAKVREKTLKKVITTSFDLPKSQNYETVPLKVEEGLLREYGKERAFNEEIIPLLPESPCKEKLLSELRKKKRMGDDYFPEVDKNFKQKLADTLKNKREASMNAVKDAVMGAIAEQEVQTAQNLSKVGIDYHGLMAKEVDLDAAKAAAQENIKTLSSMENVDQEAVEKLKETLNTEDEVTSNIQKVRASIAEKMAPMKAIKEKGVIPESTKKAFKYSFGKEMGEEQLRFSSREEVEAHYAKGLSFKETSLKGLELDGIDLHEANLEEADLNGISLKQANLQGCNFTKARLKNAVLNKANMKECCVKQADFTNAKLNGTDLSSADGEACLFWKNEISDITMSGGNFKHASFIEVVLSNAKARQSSFEKATFMKTTIGNCDFEESTFKHVGFNESTLLKSTCHKSNFNNVTFYKSTVSECDFYKGSLAKVALNNNSSFNKCLLQECNISKSYFNKALINECEFKKSDLSGAYAKETLFNKSNFKFITAKKGRCDGSAFLQCNLSKANFMHASFRFCDLNGVDISDSNFFGCDIHKIKVYDVNFENALFERTGLNHHRERLLHDKR